MISTILDYVLSCIIMYYHVLSCIIMYYHVLSCPQIIGISIFSNDFLLLFQLVNFSWFTIPINCCSPSHWDPIWGSTAAMWPRVPRAMRRWMVAALHRLPNLQDQRGQSRTLVESHGKMLENAPDFCGVHHEKWGKKGEKWRKTEKNGEKWGNMEKHGYTKKWWVGVNPIPVNPHHRKFDELQTWLGFQAVWVQLFCRWSHPENTKIDDISILYIYIYIYIYVLFFFKIQFRWYEITQPSHLQTHPRSAHFEKKTRSVSTESGTLMRSALKRLRAMTGWTSNCGEEVSWC